MARKLATIRKVHTVLPIEGADRIELALVDGWQVVVSKGEFSIGDLAVYFEIDSFLNASDPRYASFEDRFTNWGEKRGMRLKTIKLRKQLSQGLLMPVSKFPEITKVEEGLDVTEVLKIEKWEPLEEAFHNNGGNTKSSAGKRFPAWIRKTDQERVQNYKAIVERVALTDESFESSVKMDGSSLSAFAIHPRNPNYKDAVDLKKTKIVGIINKIKAFFKGLFTEKQALTGVCSRNLILADCDGSNFSKANEKYGITERLKAMSDLTLKSYAIQGEIVAPDIQENYEKVTEVEFYAFDIFDIDEQRYMLPKERMMILEHLNNMKVDSKFQKIQHVPILETEMLLPRDGTVDILLNYAEGPGKNAGVKREGVVFKSNSRDFSFKAISNSYLLTKDKKG